MSRDTGKIQDLNAIVVEMRRKRRNDVMTKANSVQGSFGPEERIILSRKQLEFLNRAVAEYDAGRRKKASNKVTFILRVPGEPDKVIKCWVQRVDYKLAEQPAPSKFALRSQEESKELLWEVTLLDFQGVSPVGEKAEPEDTEPETDLGPSEGKIELA